MDGKTYLPRTIEAFIANATTQFPVLLLTGARQVGKTTVLRHLSGQERAYVTLDDPLVLSVAREDPALFFQRFRPPLLIDEIQYAPGLLPYIKMEADRGRRPGLFWLTGSQHFHLMKGISESLAGRVAVVHLLGLSRRELLGTDAQAEPFLPVQGPIGSRMKTGGTLSLSGIYKLIWRGAFPAVALNEAVDRDLFYGSYVQTYLQRDVRDLARVGDEMVFLRFVRALAARTAQILNISDLARDAGVAVNTARSWLSILQASGIAYLLEPYHSNISKRMIKAPKSYLLDTGLCAYLTGWSSPETLEAGAMGGPILETWILSELLRSYHHRGLSPPFYYYRDKDKQEIDLLIVRDGTVYPLEFKKTASPGRRDAGRFRLLEKLGMPIGAGGVICLAEQSLPLTETAQSIPITAL
ncbi:MAG: ATP-binding protein [Acidobacteria bacterium]|nr:ATP-binding protein [Acidobacteriota bacterium]